MHAIWSHGVQLIYIICSSVNSKYRRVHINFQATTN